MADTLALIRQGMADAIGVIPGWQVSPYMLSSPSPPAMHVLPGPTEFDKAMARGSDLRIMLVQVFVALGTDIGAQKELDKFLAGAGADSVKEALEADRTLGGAAETLRVTEVSGYRTYDIQGRGPALGCEFRVEVWASGT